MEPTEGAPRTITAQMIKPRVDSLLAQTDSHYAAVLVAAKRARQLNSYYRALGEGSYEEYTPPMVDVKSGNYLTIALEELASGKIKYEYKA
jgi:DNA-directed RNA polymerase subunit omega